jgi:hypothetical protein
MENVIGAGGERDKASIHLYTKSGRRIPNERRQERHPEGLKAAAEQFTRRPSVKLRSATGTYSCVGLIFASRRTWIDIDHIDWILAGDEYYKVEDERLIMPGDLILYRNGRREPTHIGVVIERKPRVETATWVTVVLSQWGHDGEYIHDINDVHEFLGLPAEYYSERKVLN